MFVSVWVVQIVVVPLRVVVVVRGGWDFIIVTSSIVTAERWRRRGVSALIPNSGEVLDKMRKERWRSFGASEYNWSSGNSYTNLKDAVNWQQTTVINFETRDILESVSAAEHIVASRGC